MTKRNTPERDFQAAVVRLANLCGWRVYHTYDSRRCEPGFPDLVLVGHGRVLWRELKKSGKARVTKPQREWLEALTDAGQDAAVWTPESWDAIGKELTRKRVT